jgi:hypothetical protein
MVGEKSRSLSLAVKKADRRRKLVKSSVNNTDSTNLFNWIVTSSEPRISLALKPDSLVWLRDGDHEFRRN